MSDFAVNVEQHAGGTVARLTGQLTVSDTPILKRGLSAALEGEPDRVVLDASDLTFICSSGLGALVEFRNHAADHGATLRLAGAPHDVADVFRRTRLVELFPIFPDAEQALTDRDDRKSRP